MQLMRLQPAWDGCRLIYVTTDPDLRQDAEVVAAARGQAKPRFAVVQEANRWQKARLCLSLLQMAALVMRFRPDVVVSTGAAPGFFALRLGKLLGARTIWVDSMANAEELSLSGMKAGPHADLWLTQWPHLADHRGPQYKGSVI